MQDERVIVREFCNRPLQHVHDTTKSRVIRNRIADDLSIKQINNRGQKDLFAKQMKLRNIGRPFLMGCTRSEIPVEKVRSFFSHLASVRIVFLHPDPTEESQASHKLGDSLMVNGMALSFQFFCHTTIAVPTMVLVIDGSDGFFD